MYKGQVKSRLSTSNRKFTENVQRSSEIPVVNKLLSRQILSFRFDKTKWNNSFFFITRVTKQFSYPKSFYSCARKWWLTQLYFARNHWWTRLMLWECFLPFSQFFSLESFAETLVVVVSVQWQTFTFVLTRPTATRCLSNECIIQYGIIHMQFNIRRNQMECAIYNIPVTFILFLSPVWKFSWKPFANVLSDFCWQ